MCPEQEGTFHSRDQQKVAGKSYIGKGKLKRGREEDRAWDGKGKGGRYQERKTESQCDYLFWNILCQGSLYFILNK